MVIKTKNINLLVPHSIDKYMSCNESLDTINNRPQKTAQTTVHKTIMILRSNLSERKPMGHWNIAPAIVIKNNNNEISKILKFTVAA